ncbi:MAG: hypothetical protein JWQ90_2137 [Hydrocarboniphaga sp.]|uniref:TonB-dependent receptor n=1 Tax=Hydrocarboniphaga sp. TaxID=2033016 RepID=UPI002625E267|nr:TonB-dependent receptor plug domain-containing protein [Hydrocarboniphaga sp.]MDB5969687.1 hypothetical protein [Hydrocarboniphaga sp.]
MRLSLGYALMLFCGSTQIASATDPVVAPETDSAIRIEAAQMTPQPQPDTGSADAAPLAAETGAVKEKQNVTEKAADDEPKSAIEEVFVTAQKRSESVMKTPIAVTAISGDDLAAGGITDTGSLKFVSPGLTYDEFGGYQFYYIRGVGADFVAPGTNSSVAIYQDGIFMPLAPTGGQTLFDVQRVEVLNGPQGTLYGRNTTAGAINIITKRPSMDALSYKVAAGLGNYDSRNLAAYVTGPLAENLAGSVAFSYDEQSPYIKNKAPGADGVDDESTGNVRGKLLYRLGEGAEAELAGWYVKSDNQQNGAFKQFQPDSTGVALGGTQNYARHDIYNDVPFDWGARQAGGDLKVKMPFTGFDLVSLTGYQDVSTPITIDYDATEAPVAFFVSETVTRAASQELQFVSNGDGPLQWVGGLYAYYNYSAFDHLSVPAGTTPPITFDQPQQHIDDASRSNAYAAYAQASYKFGAEQNWRLTLGSRYSLEKARLDKATITVDGAGQVAELPGGAHKNWTDFSPKISLDYSTDNSLTYFTISRGFKAGSYNLPSPGDTHPVDPEKLTAFELGYKLSFADGRARLEAALYDYDYRDLQVATITDQTAPTQLDNAKKAAVRGVEINLVAKPLASLQINTGFSYMFEHEYKDFEDGVAFIDNGAGNTPTPRDFSGNTLAHSPKWSGNVGISYSRSLPMGDVQVSTNVYHSGHYFFDSSNDARATQDSYTVLNARAVWAHIANRWSVALWGNNLTNEKYYSQQLLNALGMFGQYAPPMTLGVTLGYELD